MNLLVTGGCGFIGSNFIRQRLLEAGSPLRRLVNLDALTYAGNPANLADLAGDPGLALGEIGGLLAVGVVLAAGTALLVRGLIPGIVLYRPVPESGCCEIGFPDMSLNITKLYHK